MLWEESVEPSNLFHLTLGRHPESAERQEHLRCGSGSSARRGRSEAQKAGFPRE